MPHAPGCLEFVFWKGLVVPPNIPSVGYTCRFCLLVARDTTLWCLDQGTGCLLKVPCKFETRYAISRFIINIKLVPRRSFGNLAKSTISAFTTDDGFKFSINLLAESSSNYVTRSPGGAYSTKPSPLSLWPAPEKNFEKAVYLYVKLVILILSK